MCVGELASRLARAAKRLVVFQLAAFFVLGNAHSALTAPRARGEASAAPPRERYAELREERAALAATVARRQRQFADAGTYPYREPLQWRLDVRRMRAVDRELRTLESRLGMGCSVD